MISSGMLAGTLTDVGCVDCALALCWSNWPFYIVTGCGGWWRTCDEARPVHMVNRPASIASHHVETTGEKSDT
jgi:hypothetical protein